MGAGVVGLSAKLWVFTLGAIGAIGEAELGPASSAVVFLVFVVAAESIHLGLVAMAYASPGRASRILVRTSDALRRYDRVIMITLGLVFGTWFMLKALAGFGLI